MEFTGFSFLFIFWSDEGIAVVPSLLHKQGSALKQVRCTCGFMPMKTCISYLVLSAHYMSGTILDTAKDTQVNETWA